MVIFAYRQVLILLCIRKLAPTRKKEKGERRRAPRQEGWNKKRCKRRKDHTHRHRHTKKRLQVNLTRSPRRTAAAYSPTWWGSTIGDGGLNFSVRNGKRWFPAAIATAICYLREIINALLNEIYSFVNFLAYLSLRKDFGLLVQVD